MGKKEWTNNMHQIGLVQLESLPRGAARHVDPNFRIERHRRPTYTDDFNFGILVRAARWSKHQHLIIALM